MRIEYPLAAPQNMAVTRLQSEYIKVRLELDESVTVNGAVLSRPATLRQPRWLAAAVQPRRVHDATERRRLQAVVSKQARIARQKLLNIRSSS